jgi:hypothetical protein
VKEMDRLTALPKGAEIVAHRGSLDYLLIKTGNDGEGHDLGRVWRKGYGRLFPEMYVDAIVKFGYWEPYEGSQGLLTEIEKELADRPDGTAPEPDRADSPRAARGQPQPTDDLAGDRIVV